MFKKWGKNKVSIRVEGEKRYGQLKAIFTMEKTPH